MVRKKDINEINAKLDTITSTMSKKAMAYDKEQEYLKDVQIRIRKAYPIFDEHSMRAVVKIEYEVTPTTLFIDNEGESLLNARFKAMNELKLIPLADLQLVTEAISKAVKINGGDAN